MTTASSNVVEATHKAIRRWFPLGITEADWAANKEAYALEFTWRLHMRGSDKFEALAKLFQRIRCGSNIIAQPLNFFPVDRKHKTEGDEEAEGSDENPCGDLSINDIYLDGEKVAI